jgi:hypothetical protein
MRFYYYASAMADGRWQLTCSFEPAATTHASRELAVLFARRRCRIRWEEQHQPCGIRVQGEGGIYEDIATFGQEDDEPS